MKAEQRKELETNTLADKMGHVMQRVKASPRRTFFTYFFIIAALAAVSWFGWRYYSETKRASSFQWLQIYDGAGNHIMTLAETDKTTNAGKAARFQIAWLLYWDFGVKKMGTEQLASLGYIQEAGRYYSILAEECKDDPVLAPQALLGKAVVEETMAVQHVDHLKEAKKYYEMIVEKHKDSAEAKFAEGRLEWLKGGKRGDLENTYEMLHRLLNVPEPAPQFAPGPGDAVPQPKGGKKGGGPPDPRWPERGLSCPRSRLLIPPHDLSVAVRP
jgi:hypothetical protein